ncbi:hypothetical protein B0H19DRAFT_1242960, partial [Mycena capillaripes]
MSTFGLFLPSWSRVVDGVSAPAVSAPIHLHLHQNDRLTFGALFEIEIRCFAAPCLKGRKSRVLDPPEGYFRAI